MSTALLMLLMVVHFIERLCILISDDMTWLDDMIVYKSDRVLP